MSGSTDKWHADVDDHDNVVVVVDDSGGDAYDVVGIGDTEYHYVADDLHLNQI